jgi:hypothetical protein
MCVLPLRDTGLQPVARVGRFVRNEKVVAESFDPTIVMREQAVRCGAVRFELFEQLTREPFATRGCPLRIAGTVQAHGERRELIASSFDFK